MTDALPVSAPSELTDAARAYDLALAACRPNERRFVLALAENEWQPAKTARAIGLKHPAAWQRLVSRPRVGAAIDALDRLMSISAGLTTARILSEVASIAFSDVGEMVDQDGALKPLHELPSEVRRAIQSVEVEERDFLTRDGDISHIDRKRKLKLWSKNDALKLAAQIRKVVSAKDTNVTVHNHVRIVNLTGVKVGGRSAAD